MCAPRGPRFLGDVDTGGCARGGGVAVTAARLLWHLELGLPFPRAGVLGAALAHPSALGTYRVMWCQLPSDRLLFLGPDFKPFLGPLAQKLGAPPWGVRWLAGRLSHSHLSKGEDATAGARQAGQKSHRAPGLVTAGCPVASGIFVALLSFLPRCPCSSGCLELCVPTGVFSFDSGDACVLLKGWTLL